MNAPLSGGGLRPLLASERLQAVTAASVSYNSYRRRKSLLSHKWERSSADGCRNTAEYRHDVYVDDLDLMVSLMQHAEPSIPPPVVKPVDTSEIEQSAECQQYIKNLTRAIEEGVARKRRPHLKSVPPSREATSTAAAAAATTSAAGGGGGGMYGVSTETLTEVPSHLEDKGALQMWEEEQEEKEKEEQKSQRGGESVDSGASMYNRNRPLLNTIAKGRFPMHVNALVSDVVRNWGREGYSKTFLTSNENVDTRSRFLDRLRQEPLRSWRVIHDLITDPPSSSPIADRQRKSYDISEDSRIVEKWRHKFDHMIYEDQFKIDDALTLRDRSRHMVIRHETLSTGQPPLTALQNVFNENRSRPFTAPSGVLKPNTGGDYVKSSVWMRRANEIALEKEREHLITAIRQFELREAAASLSKEAVESLRDDLIKLLMLWPCDYRKRHIFTKRNFVRWMRERQKLPSTVGSIGDGTESISLAESMASRAEAAFIEYVLAVLPGGHSTMGCNKV